MLTKTQSKERDMKVVKFIQTIPCYSNTIAKQFYSSQRLANQHLKLLHEQGYINKYRKFAHEPYFYYTGKLKSHREHFDLIAKSYCWLLAHNFNIINYNVQLKINGIMPDLIAEIEKDNKKGILAVEIERSYGNLKQTIKKYGNTEFKSLLLVSHLPTGAIESEYIEKLYNINFKELE